MTRVILKRIWGKVNEVVLNDSRRRGIGDSKVDNSVKEFF